jgi:hypothetical protein
VKKRTTRSKGLSRRGVIPARNSAGRWKKEREWSGKGDGQDDQQGRRLELGWRKGTRDREIVRGEARLKRQGN